MSQPTYTVTGTLSAGKLNLSAYLPQLTGDSYAFVDFYNVSKTKGHTKVNAILIHLKTENGIDTELVYNGTDPLAPLPVIDSSSPMTNHSLAPQLDWDANEILVILYHEPKTTADVNSMQKEVINSYNAAKLGAFSTTWAMKQIQDLWNKSQQNDEVFDAAAPFFNPRKAGMTIITKS